MTPTPILHGATAGATASPCPAHPVHPRDRLLATVSHELRQPLSLIQMHVDLLTRLPMAMECPAIARAGDMIKRAVQSQGRIIDDLLEFSRARTGKLVLERLPVDLAEVLTTLAAAFASEAFGKLPFIELMDSVSVVCLGDRTRIEQILGNLLRNAIRFTPNHGRIRIRVGREGAFCKVSVVDSGCGIAAEFLPHVFDMFNQAPLHGRPSNSGLGIGLALVQELTLAHGGRVEAHSNGVGRGAEFNVWLPAHDESAQVPPTSIVRGAFVPGDGDERLP